MRVRINLDTNTAAVNLTAIASKFSSEEITLTDGKGLKINAKSLLGTYYARFEFDEIWLEAEEDHYMDFNEFII